MFVEVEIERTMKTQTIGMKNIRFLFPLSVLLLISLLLSACAGGSAINNWPGVSANQGTVYLSYQGYVYAVAPGNSTPVWKFPKEKGDLTKPFYAAPGVGADGTVVVGNYGSVLYALTADGVEKWQFTTENAYFVATPLVLDDIILAPASDDYLYAISLDGKQLWKYKTNNVLWAQPASDGELVFQPGLDHFVYALRIADGSLAWKTDLESSLSSAPVLSEDGGLYISTMGGEVVSLDKARGSVKWKFQTQGSLWASPVLNGETLYVGSSIGKTKGNVYAISAASGQKVWEKDAGGPVVAGGVLLPEGGNIAFPTENGNLSAYALADGSSIWSQAIGGKLYSTPVVAGDDLVVAVTQGENKILQAVTFNGQNSWSFALPK